MTTLQKTFVAVTVVALAGTGIFEARQNFKLREQVQILQQQQAQLTAQIQRSELALNDATNQLAGLLVENARLKSNSNGHELLKLFGDATALRAEIAALRQSAREQTTNESIVTGWANRISSLKQKLDEMPDKLIPEFAFLSDEDWAAVTRAANLDTDDGIRKALQALRSAAKENFLNSTRAAIRRYAASANGSDLPQDPVQFAQAVNANGRLLPYEMAQLKPYYDVPVDDALLQRYQFLHPAASVAVKHFIRAKSDPAINDSLGFVDDKKIEKLPPVFIFRPTHWDSIAGGTRDVIVGEPTAGRFVARGRILK